MDRDRANELSGVLAQLAHLLTTTTTEPRQEQPATGGRPMPAPVLLTVAEAAKKLRIGKTKAYALVMSGEIESVQIGRLRRIHTDAVNAYAARLVAEQNSDRPAA